MGFTVLDRASAGPFIVALSYVLSPRLGAQGLAIGYACGWAVACAMTGLLVARTESRLRSSVALAGGRA